MPELVKTSYLGIIFILFSYCVGGEGAQGQDALVTLYSHGSFLTTGIPGTKQDIYVGSIFDGSQRLFGFSDSFFAHNNRYITLRFAAGPHTFGASNGKRPEARETLHLELKDGETYFIRAQGESKGVPGILEIQHGRLDLVPCTKAQTELTNAKPLGDRALAKAMRPTRATLVVDENSPPACL